MKKLTDISSTELGLAATPTGGVEASHSPHFRRLLSAGYKGFLQGSLGGASLYGMYGFAIGTLAALAALPFAYGALGFGVFGLIPAFTAIGIVKGADTFGNIGSMAAISAESNDLSEQRRLLIERYRELPLGPEADREADTIRKELAAQEKDGEKPRHMFHLKTVLIGAAVGLALVAGFLLLAPYISASGGVISTIIEGINGILPAGMQIAMAHGHVVAAAAGATHAAVGAATASATASTIASSTALASGAMAMPGATINAALLSGSSAITNAIAADTAATIGTTLSAGVSGTLLAIGSVVGAFAGATIGLDRYYVRKWFDHTEGVVHPNSHLETALAERQQQVERLRNARMVDRQVAAQNAVEPAPTAANATAAATPLAPQVALTSPALPPTASLSAAAQPQASSAAADAHALHSATAPDPRVTEATYQRRLTELQHALANA